MTTTSTLSGSTATTSTSAARGSDGCVVCGSVASCPDCGSGEYCVMTSLTCDSCSYTYCAKQSNSQLSGLNSTSTSSSSHSSNKNGEIIGVTLGVIGGVVVIVLVTLFFINRKYWKPRRQRIKASRLEEASRNYGNEDEYFEDGDEDDDDEDDDDDDDDDEDDDGGMRKDENYTKFNPPLVPPSLNVPGNRSSTSTTRTRASNILPIAYIPGVTSALTAEKLQSKLRSSAKRQHAAGDIRSHITLGSSILDGLDEEYDDHNLNSRGMHSNDSEDNLITAIRAKPKLVQIAEEESDKEIQDLDIIEEQSETGDAAEDDPHTRNDADADADDDDDDEGSFILDLEIPESIREGTNDERVESPFEDKFQIHGEQ
ncbi:hypothetical protein SUVZ_16G3510 [Saccharomyces uvarum]|uniref:Membrane anchor Opy2 N-terminal domain-containing protein n=1 Tax=Saccharomyces uvarum TaxID=230603 RepID=A0ABN8WQ66_SACUV|nr:hypothetical protein SUVZ_16G3510 [Saccharomyces uvarum]